MKSKQFFDAFAGGLIGSAAVISGMAWFGKQAVAGMMTAAADRFRSQLKLDEIKKQTGVQTTADFMAQQLSEFYWPIYIRLQKDNAVWDRILVSVR